MQKRKKYGVIMLFLLVAGMLNAQKTITLAPSVIKTSLPKIESTYTIQDLPSEQFINSESLPMQAGFTVDIDQTKLNQLGQWDSTNQGKLVWRILFKVSNSNGLNVYFTDVHLNEDETLFVYNPGIKTIRGVYTKINNGDFLPTDSVTGNTLVVEYNTMNKNRTLPFHISELGVFISEKDEKGFGDAGNCEVHINCSEGDNWQNQQRGVARVLVKQGSSTFWCSGTLVNNTKLDGKPYFLTANHCGQTSSTADYSQWLFYFNFEAENCEEPAIEPTYNVLNGSRLLSHSISSISTGSDFKLLLLDNNIPPDFRPYYNGWSRTAEPSPSGVTIHHPQGDLKMISTYTQPLTSSQYSSSSEDPTGKYWQVYWSATENGHGVTEGGSSGSPVFNSDGLVVGSLTGGGSSCDFLSSPDYYGKFNISWQPAGSIDSTQLLSYWLDPENTGTISLQGSNLDTTAVNAWFEALDPTIVLGESVRFTNSSFGKINNYSWKFEGGTPASSILKNPEDIKYEKAGTFNVQLVVSSETNSDTLVRQKYIHVMPQIAPNPGNGYFNITFGGEIPKDINVEVFDLSGRKAEFILNYINDSQVQVDISNCREGFYLIKYTSYQQNNTFKVSVIK